MFKNIWAGLDWLFPPTCGGCGTAGVRWCQICQEKVQLIAGNVCEICGLPQVHPGLCSRCKKDRPAYKLLRSWAVFEQPLQSALHSLKYRRDIGLGEALSTHMVGFLSQLNWQ